tara:strand:- start:879 stop:1232 length:354 start_codon:yes stop_codon:yes gene_type:complete
MKCKTNKKQTKGFKCNRCGRNDFTNGHALGGHKKYCLKPEYYNKKKFKKKIKSEKKLKRNIVNVNKKEFNINIDELYESLFGSKHDLLNDYNKFKFVNEEINYTLEYYNVIAKELGF